MTAQCSFFLATGMCFLAITPVIAGDVATQEAIRRVAGRSWSGDAVPSTLGSLRGVDKVEALYLILPGSAPPIVRLPGVVTAARSPTLSVTPVIAAPRDGGTNLYGMLRDPRATGVTPAGLRFADPGWMRKQAGDKR